LNLLVIKIEDIQKERRAHKGATTGRLAKQQIKELRETRRNPIAIDEKTD
jgi:hypothetical protein